MLKTGLLNIVLRLLSSVSRLGLFLGLARYLSVEDLGRFGLVLATIQIFILAAGVEFHQFATRSLVDSNESRWPSQLRDQALVHGAAYALLLPVSCVLFIQGWMTASAVLWLYPLLLVEHVCQELQRLLVTRSRPLRANCVLFFRSGLWVWAVVVIMAAWPPSRDLRLVWAAWFVGGLAGVWIGWRGMSDLHWGGVFSKPIDVAWIREGMRVAAPYIVAVVAYRGITTIDRYLLAGIAGEAATGVYVLFFGIVSTLLVLAESGVVTIVAPTLIRSARGRDPVTYRSTMARVTNGIVALVCVVSAGLAIFMSPVLVLTGRPVFLANLHVCWILLAATVVATLGLIPHLALYAARRDRPIVLSAVAGLIAATASHLVLIPGYGATGAAVATLIGMTVVSGSKAALARRHVSRSLA